MAQNIKRPWHGGNKRCLGNPGGIYATNPKTKMCDHVVPKKQKNKNYGKAFVDIKDQNKYVDILTDLYKGFHDAKTKTLNEKYNLDGSYNFYNDLKNDAFEQYHDWYSQFHKK